jgi:platelet-activating factor acetylhydrolase IB subunit alpha
MLPTEQQRDLELAIWQYMADKGYVSAQQALQSESTVLSQTDIARNDERILERKWLTIIKLQSKILELEKKLAVAEDLLSKSVRTLNNPSDADKNSKDNALAQPVLKLSKTYKGHRDIVTSVAVHESEPVFATGSGDSTLRIYDYELQDQVAILKGHTHSVNCVAWAKEELVSGSSDMSIKIWRSANKTNVFDFREFYCTRTMVGHEHSISALMNLLDTSLTVSVSRDKTIRVWDRSSGYCRKTIDDVHDEWIRSCDANGKHLLTTGNDKKVFVFELEQIMNFDSKGNRGTPFANVFDAHDNYIEAIRVYKNGKLGQDETVAVTASRDKTICVWNYMNGNLLAQLTGHENWVKDIQIYQQGNFLVSAGEDKTLRIWDLNKKKQLFVEQGAHDHFVSCLALHPQFRIVVSGSVDKTAKVWKLVNSSSSDLLNALSSK